METKQTYKIQENFISNGVEVAMQLIPDNATPLHKHVHYEIFYVLSGEIRHTLNGSSQLLTAGDCILLSPEDLHSFTKGKPSLNRDILISTQFFEQLLYMVTHSKETSAEFLSKRGEPVHFSITELSDLENLAQQYSANNDIYKKRCLSMEIILKILHKFFEKQDKKIYPSTSPLVSQIFETLNKDMGIKGGIPRICSWLKYSQSYICHTFKKQTGMTLSDYIKELRLKRISYYLKATNFSLREIAELVGIESMSYMNKIFKEKFDMTPMQYRRSHRITLDNATPPPDESQITNLEPFFGTRET